MHGAAREGRAGQREARDGARLAPTTQDINHDPCPRRVYRYLILWRPPWWYRQPPMVCHKRKEFDALHNEDALPTMHHTYEPGVPWECLTCLAWWRACVFSILKFASLALLPPLLPLRPLPPLPPCPNAQENHRHHHGDVSRFRSHLSVPKQVCGGAAL